MEMYIRALQREKQYQSDYKKGHFGDNGYTLESDEYLEQQVQAQRKHLHDYIEKITRVYEYGKEKEIQDDILLGY